MRQLSRALVVASLLAPAFGLPQTLQLPPLPELSESQLDAFHDSASAQIRDALRQAQENALDAAHIGRLGMVLQAYELHDEAAACYERARLVDRDPFPWTYYLARIRDAQGSEPQLALDLYQEAQRQNPRYFPARLKLVEALLKSGLIEQADRETALLLENHRDSAWVQYLLGRVKEARTETEQAAQAYRTACELAPRFGPAHYALGLVYRRLGLSEQARAHLQLYSENQASVPPVDDPLMEEIENLKSGPYHLVEEGKRLYVQGKINEAFAKYVEAVELNPRLVHAHVNLISIYAMKGDLQAAQKHYQAALDLSPNLVEAHYNYGLALSHEKLYRQAEAALRKSLEYNPYFADAYNNLGVVLEAQGRPDEAQENYKAAIEHDPSHREAYFSLGRFAMKQGNPQEAIAFFLRCLTPEDQKTATFMYTLAYVYAGVRNHTQARYYGEKARGLAESYADQRMVDILNRFLGELKRAETARSPEQ